jgi:uncharacterized repeat protein (TIGR03847 family)
MSDQNVPFHQVKFITVDAIGEPGERIFFLQATTEDQVVSFLLEKAQVESLAVALAKLLTELASKKPELKEVSFAFEEEKMHIQPPVDPVFRIGEMGMAYDEEFDQVVLVLQEVKFDDVTETNAQKLGLRCTRQQLATLSSWALEIVSRGRPLCPLCNQPMEKDHLCPKKNGNRH